MTETSQQYIKALFRTFVLKDVGGVDAAGALMGVSHQRVSQLISLNTADMPTIMQLVALEHAVGRAVITSALAEVVEGKEARGDLMRETSEGVTAAARTMEAVVKGERPDEIAALAVKTIQEMEDVRSIAAAKAANAA